MEPEADIHQSEKGTEQPTDEAAPDQIVGPDRAVSGISKLILKLSGSLDKEKFESFKLYDESGLRVPRSEALESNGETDCLNGAAEGNGKPVFNDGPLRATIKNRVMQRSFARGKDANENDVEEESRKKEVKLANTRSTLTQIAALKKNEEPEKTEEAAPVMGPMFAVVIGLAVAFVLSLVHILTPSPQSSQAKEVAPTVAASASLTSPINIIPSAAPIKDVKTILQKSRQDYLAGNKMTALNELFQAARLAPKDASVYAARGDYYLSEGNISSAKADFQTALALNPRLESTKRHLARCRALALKAEPESDESSAPTISSSERTDLSKLGFDELRLKAYNALQANQLNFAVAALSRCVKMRPNDALSRRYLAFAALNSGNVPLALSQFSAWDALDQSSLSDKLAFGKAVASSQGNDSQSTSNFFNNLIKVHARDADALISIAQTTIGLGIAEGPTLRALRSASVIGSSSQKEQILSLYDQLNSKQDGDTSPSTAPSGAGIPEQKLPPGFNMEEYRSRASKRGG